MGIINENPYEQNTPLKTPKMGKNKEITATQNFKESFFNKDLLTLLGQGPIKKDPIRKKRETEEKISPEMENQIEELFGKNTEFSF